MGFLSKQELETLIENASSVEHALAKVDKVLKPVTSLFSGETDASST